MVVKFTLMHGVEQTEFVMHFVGAVQVDRSIVDFWI